MAEILLALAATPFAIALIFIVAAASLVGVAIALGSEVHHG